MTNPWLSVTAADYLGHMGSPEIDQLSVLAAILRGVLERTRPRGLLVLGCGTGNGFEHIDPAVTSRVTGVDLNPEYLALLRERYPRPGFALDLHRADVAEWRFPEATFDLVHAALLFEYVEWAPLLPKLARTLRPGGAVSLVLQRPSPSAPAVTPSSFPSVRALESLFAFVDDEAVARAARTLGLAPRRRQAWPAKQGKTFLEIELEAGGSSIRP